MKRHKNKMNQKKIRINVYNKNLVKNNNHNNKIYASSK